MIYPLYGVMMRNAMPGVWDSATARLIVSSIILLAVFLTWMSSKIEKNIIWVIHISCYVITIHLFFICYKNNLEYNTAWGIAVSLLLLGAFLLTRLARIYFAALVFVCSLLVAFSVHSALPPLIFVVMNTSAALFMAIEAHIRFRYFSEQQKTEAEMREKETQMIAASRLSALGEMAGGIAHEINNPLAVIRGHAQMLEMQLLDNPLNKDRLNESLGYIVSTADRIAQIVNGLRNFAREGKSDPFERTNVYDLLESTLILCRERFKNGSVNIVVESASQQMHASLRATEISQVLLNLLNNSFDAVAGLDEKWIRVELVERPDTIVVSITDSGTGIKPEVAERMMQPFFTTKPLGKGTGLGLSISEGIVARHGGALRYDKVSHNTRFEFTLPREH